MERHDEVRRTEVLRGGEWIRVPLINVKKGDTFKMFESDGTRVTAGFPYEPIGADTFTAKEDAFDTEEGGKLVTSVTI